MARWLYWAHMSRLPSRIAASRAPFTFFADRRLAGAVLTLLVHAALVTGWKMTRSAAPQADAQDDAVQWLRLTPAAPRTDTAPALPVVPASPAPSRRAAPERVVRDSSPVVASKAPGAAPQPPLQAEASAPAPAAAASAPGASAIMESARRSVGAIDRALRKENQATIVAPPDSPQLRMREGMELARALAPPRLWEAPKVEELVNNTGDGARRTRVITGNGSYCLTERSPATNVEMIEMHGKQRFTSCPRHETPARKQVWRTARD